MRFRGLVVLCLLWAAFLVPVAAQAIADPWEGLSVEAVRIEWAGGERPPGDEATVDDRVRRTVDLYLGAQFRALLLDWGLGRLRKQPGIADAQAALAPGARGGVIGTLRLSAAEAGTAPRGGARTAYPVPGRHLAAEAEVHGRGPGLWQPQRLVRPAGFLSGRQSVGQ
jgi:hypothetical protein